MRFVQRMCICRSERKIEREIQQKSTTFGMHRASSCPNRNKKPFSYSVKAFRFSVFCHSTFEMPNKYARNVSGSSVKTNKCRTCLVLYLLSVVQKYFTSRSQVGYTFNAHFSRIKSTKQGPLRN